MQANALDLKVKKDDAVEATPAAQVGAASRRLSANSSSAAPADGFQPTQEKEPAPQDPRKLSALKATTPAAEDTKKWDEMSQEETNQAVNEMAANASDEKSYDAIADSLSGMDEEQMLAALGQLPDDADADKIVEAIHARREEEIAGENAEVHKQAQKEAEALQAKVDTVRDARDQVLAQAGELGDFQGDAAAEALLQQVEAHPELANVIALSNGDVMNNISAQLALNPENSDDTVRDLASMAEKLDPDVMEKTLTDSLHEALGENVTPLLAGLAQGSLEGESKLLTSLQAGYQGPTADLLGQAHLNREELDAIVNPQEGSTGSARSSKLVDLNDYAANLDPEVAKGLLNHLDQREPSPLQELAAQVASNSFPGGTIGEAEADMLAFSQLMESGDPEVVARVGAQMADSYAKNGSSDWSNVSRGMQQSIAEGNTSLSMSFMGRLAETHPESQAELAQMRGYVDRGFSDLATNYGKTAAVTDQHNADLAYLQDQYGAFTDPETLEQASADFRANYADAYKETDRMAAGSLKGLQQLKEFDSQYPGINQNDSTEDGYFTLLKQFNSLATNPSGTELLGESLESKGRGEPSFLDDLGAIGDQTFKKNADYLVTHAMQVKQAQLLAGGKEAADQSLEGWADITKGLGVGMPPAEVDGFVQEIKDFGWVALEAASGVGQVSVEAAAETFLAPAPGASPQRQAAARGVAGALGLGMANWGDLNDMDWVSRQGYDFVTTVVPAGTDVASAVAKWRGASSLSSGLGRVAPVMAGVSAFVGLIDIASELNKEQPDEAAIGFQAAMVAGNAAAAVGGLASIWGTASWGGPVAWAGAALATLATIGFSQYERVKESNRFEVGNGELSDHAEQFMNTILPKDFNRELLPSLMNASDEGLLTGGMLQDMATAAGVTPREMLAEFGRLNPEQASTLIENMHHWSAEYPAGEAAAIALADWAQLTGDFAYAPVHFNGGGGSRMLVV